MNDKTIEFKPTQVLHLIAPISFGGGESLLYNLLKEKNKGFSEQIALVYSSKLFEEKLHCIQIPYFLLSKKEIGQARSRLKVFFDTFVNIFFVINLLKIIKKQNIHIIHAHGYPSVLLGYIVSIFNKNIKLVYTHHFYRNKPKSKLEKYIFKKVYSRYDRCTAVSNTVRDSMNSTFEFSRKFTTIYNCISNDFFKNLDSQLNSTSIIDNQRTTFVQVARFSSFKNQKLVVESLALLDDEIKERIQVIFIGSGPEENNVKKLVEKLQLKENVLFLGMVDYDKVKYIISKCDYGLFPSELEGFGIGAVECLAYGLPVLAQDNLLMREIVSNCGILKSKETFHKGFQEMLNKNFDRKKIRAYTTKFKPKSVKKEYVSIYKSLK